jgi:hypothetical protein
MRFPILLLFALTVSVFGQSFPGTAAYQAAFLKPAAAAGTTLNDSLVAYWNMDAASGNETDQTGRGNTLVDFNTVTSAAGKVGTSRHFASASSERFSIADNADMSLGADQSFTFAAWLWLDTLVGSEGIFTKVVDAGVGDEWELKVNGGGTITLRVANGSSSATVGNHFPATGAWIFLVVGHDAANDLLFYKVNNGSLVTAAWTGGTQNTGATVYMGYSIAASYFNGRMDEAGWWKRALTETEMGELYNSGSGKTYPFN